MTKRNGTIIAFTAFFLFAALGQTKGQDAGRSNEFDPSLSVVYDLNHLVRFDFYTGREKSDELPDGKTKISGGVSLRLKPVFKRFLDSFDTDKQHALVVSTIYEYSKASDQESTTKEHKIMLDGTIRYAFGRHYLLNNRNRVEFRWVNGEYRFRYRNRPMLERPFRVGKRQVTPYISAEAFWDGKYRKWNQFKFASGLQIPFIRRSTFDVYYERQHCSTCTDRDTNIYGLTLNVYFRRKK